MKLKNVIVTVSLVLLMVLMELICALRPDVRIIGELSPYKIKAWHTILNLVSYQFLHMGIKHLLGNLLFFVPWMLLIESREGSRRLAWVCLLCGIVGGLTFLVRKSGWALVGFSGSGFGLATYGALGLGNSFIERIFSLMMVAALLIWIVLLNAPTISMSCHLGGFVCGLCLHLLYSSREPKPQPN